MDIDAKLFKSALEEAMTDRAAIAEFQAFVAVLDDMKQKYDGDLDKAKVETRRAFEMMSSNAQRLVRRFIEAAGGELGDFI
jgi:hypothetical protein